jgi:hypothetical protein
MQSIQMPDVIAPDSEALALARQLERDLPRRFQAAQAKQTLSGALSALDPSSSASVAIAKFEALGWLHPSLGIEAVAKWTAEYDSGSPHFYAQRQVAIAACALGSCLRLAESTSSRLGDSPSNPAREMLESRLADLLASWALTRTALAELSKTISADRPPESIDSAAAAVLVTALELGASGIQLATSCLSPDSVSHEVLANWGSELVRIHLSEGPWQALMDRIADGLVE